MKPPHWWELDFEARCDIAIHLSTWENRYGQLQENRLVLLEYGHFVLTWNF